ncbi:hypothetical protein Bca52824_075141 [Brassica carinata]|uniref:ENTH domain-containing protein n=1 Tax=Brassica carinata TaxID=52824 RepID=A0A8X7PRL8_BRACI|nr:hypothetical protein Bca52824_075141 [Brassica carinata]
MSSKEKGKLDYNDNAEFNVSSTAFFICLHHLCLPNQNVNNSGERYASGLSKEMSGSQSSLRRYLGAIKDTTTVSLAKVNSGYKELDIAIVKATNHVERPSKERYIRG